MFAQNSQGSRSSVTCKLHTYDVTLPSGRFEAEFATSSNPRVLKSSVVVHDDSPIVEAFVAIGFGEGIYGDQIKPFTPTNFDERDFSIDIGMHFVIKLKNTNQTAYITNLIISFISSDSMYVCMYVCMYFTNKSQEVSPFPSGDHKAAMNRRESTTNTRHI